MIVHDCLQGSDEWLALRVGKLTASDLHRFVDTSFDMRTGDMPKTLICEKLAEAYRGEALPGFSSWESEQGAAMEAEARKWFCAFHRGRVRNVGFIETDDHKFGASPDALINDDSGLELKAPQVTNHLRYFLENRVPPAYLAQVHGCIFATERASWTFCSYRRHFPAFVITVQRDEAICAKISEAVNNFNDRLQSALAKLRS